MGFGNYVDFDATPCVTEIEDRQHMHAEHDLSIKGRGDPTAMTKYDTSEIRMSDDTPDMARFLFDAPTGKRYVIEVRHVDFRPFGSPIGNGLVRFTRREHSPCQTGDILLRTPAYHRKREGGDELDGGQLANLAPMTASWLCESGSSVGLNSFTAEGKLAASKEPWILCTSITPAHDGGARGLERRFSKKGTDAALTIIKDPNAFARQLGIDVARSAEARDAVREDAFDLVERHLMRLACGADKDVDALVRVYHGPIHYENSILRPESAGDIASIDAIPIWFTKRTSFLAEREYRFAVTVGCPATDTFRLPVSPELARLMVPRRLGDRWWSS